MSGFITITDKIYGEFFDILSKEYEKAQRDLIIKDPRCQEAQGLISQLIELNQQARKENPVGIFTIAPCRLWGYFQTEETTERYCQTECRYNVYRKQLHRYFELLKYQLEAYTDPLNQEECLMRRGMLNDYGVAITPSKELLCDILQVPHLDFEGSKATDDKDN